MSHTLTFLGTGSSLSEEGRNQAGILIDDTILIDCSPTAPLALKKLGRNLADIDAILFTHFHGDHIGGVPLFLKEIADDLDSGKKLAVFAPAGFRETVEPISRVYYAEKGVALIHHKNLVHHGIKDGTEIEFGSFKGQTVKVDHGSKEAFGYRLEFDGKIVVFTGDTARCEALNDLLKGADIFITEMTLQGSGSEKHLAANDIAELKALSDPNTRFFVTHVGDAPRKEIPGVTVAQDFMQIEF